MSATTSSSTATSMRAIRRTRPIAACASAASAPCSSISALTRRASGERTATPLMNVARVTDQADDDPELAPAPVGVEHHRDAHEQDHEPRGREDLLADERRLPGDRRASCGSLRRSALTARDREQHAAACQPILTAACICSRRSRTSSTGRSTRRRRSLAPVDVGEYSAALSAPERDCSGTAVEGVSMRRNCSSGSAASCKLLEGAGSVVHSLTSCSSRAADPTRLVDEELLSAAQRPSALGSLNAMSNPCTASAFQSERSPKLRSSACVQVVSCVSS